MRECENWRHISLWYLVSGWNDDWWSDFFFPPHRQEALLAAISEKDANIALLELSSSKKKKTQDEVALLKREKDRLVHQLKQQVKSLSCLLWEPEIEASCTIWRTFCWNGDKGVVHLQECSLICWGSSVTLGKCSLTHLEQFPLPTDYHSGVNYGRKWKTAWNWNRESLERNRPKIRTR